MDRLDVLQLGADDAFECGGVAALVEYLLRSNVNALLSDPVPPSVSVHDDICAHCHHPLTPDVREGNWICLGCATCTYMDASVQVKHGGIVAWADTLHHEVLYQYRPYKRKSRLMDVLNQVQNSKHATIPPDVLAAICVTFANLEDVSALTHAHVRTYMKMEGWGKYYKYIPQVLFHLKGKGPPTLPQKMQFAVMARFARLQRPFEELVKPLFKRKNFLCYTYVTRQCLFLEGAPLLLQESYSVSKDPSRLFKLDRMWKVMCESLGWTFRPLSAKGIKAFKTLKDPQPLDVQHRRDRTHPHPVEQLQAQTCRT
jgi:hypothetical protein